MRFDGKTDSVWKEASGTWVDVPPDDCSNPISSLKP